MKIADILGTRPEIIKTSPFIRESERQGLDYFILHTGQYYSYNLDKIFFEELELPKLKCNLDVGAGTHAEESGKMPILEKLYCICLANHKITQIFTRKQLYESGFNKLFAIPSLLTLISCVNLV